MRRLTLADGHPYHGQMVAVMDESVPAAGAGVYYILSAVVVCDPVNVAGAARQVVGERRRPFHYAKEGPEIVERMLSLIEEEVLMATCLWSPTGRRGQIATRGELLREHAQKCEEVGVDHLIIESGDETTDLRDQAALLDTFREDGDIPYRYDWRSKAEPLLWIADAASGIAAEHLLGRKADCYQRLETAGLIEVVNVDMRKPRLPS